MSTLAGNNDKKEKRKLKLDVFFNSENDKGSARGARTRIAYWPVALAPSAYNNYSNLLVFVCPSVTC